MALVTPERKRIHLEDVQYGTSVSEAVANKMAATMNFIIDNFVDRMVFGVEPSVSGLAVYPSVGLGSSEIAPSDYEIRGVTVTLEESGISGLTQFMLERRPYGSGTWSSIFSTDCGISHTAANGLMFASTDSVAPSGVTLPILNITELEAGDEIRFTLVQAADQALNLTVYLDLRPN